MKRLTAVITLLFTSLNVAASGATTLHLKSGYVRYEVRLKTLGVGGDVVSAVNRKVIGKIAVSGDGRIEGGLIIPVVGFD